MEGGILLIDAEMGPGEVIADAEVCREIELKFLECILDAKVLVDELRVNPKPVVWPVSTGFVALIVVLPLEASSPTWSSTLL